MRILLVEDHPVFLEGLRNPLAARGMEVVGIATNGMDALGKAQAPLSPGMTSRILGRLKDTTKTYALSWSGGKDCAMALYVARRSGMDVSMLLSMMWPGGITASNGAPQAVVEAQARAAGARLITGAPVDWNGYESEFRRLLARVKDKGAAGCIFGDIDIEDHREWGRRMCSEAGLEAHYPLWGMSHCQAMSEFLRLGFEALVVVVDLAKMDDSWLGRKLDRQAIEDLAALGVSVAGEFGEYHTLVTGGPVFRESLAGLWEGRDRRIVTRDGHAFLDLSSPI